MFSTDHPIRRPLGEEVAETQFLKGQGIIAYCASKKEENRVVCPPADRSHRQTVFSMLLVPEAGASDVSPASLFGFLRGSSSESYMTDMGLQRISIL